MSLTVLLITPQLDVGGAETMVVDLANGLVAAGVTVHLASRPGVLADTLDAGVRFHPVQWETSTSALIGFIETIRRITQTEGRIDAFHAHSVLTTIAARLACPAGYLITTVHGLSDRHYALARILLARLSNLICPVSHDTAGRLRTPRTKTQVIWTGVRSEGLKSTGEQQINATKTLICVARLSPEKGHDRLLRLFASAGLANKNYQLMLVGDGPEREKLESLASDLSISQSVSFLGQRKDVNALLQEADAFVLTSYREGIPRAVIEAVYAGLPVVAADVGGLKEVAEVTSAVQFVDPNDPSEWARRVEAAVKARRDGKTSIVDPAFEARFGYDEMIKTHVSIYGAFSRGRRT